MRMRGYLPFKMYRPHQVLKFPSVSGIQDQIKSSCRWNLVEEGNAKEIDLLLSFL